MMLTSLLTTTGKAKDYLPVLVDGREWVYRDSDHFHQPPVAVNYWVQRTFCKDSLINGKYKNKTKVPSLRSISILPPYFFTVS